jgi:hypothetical protein
MWKSTEVFTGSLIALLVGVQLAAAQSTCKDVKQCADEMLRQAAAQKEINQSLSKRISLLENALVDYKRREMEFETFQNRFNNLHVTLGVQTDKQFNQGDFYGPAGYYPVAHTCPENSVLVGLEFDMSSFMGAVRAPTRIKYICKKLQP